MLLSDQSFVRGLPENDQDSAIVKEIIAMALDAKAFELFLKNHKVSCS